jgi:DHA2 family multidrug resistance protein
MFIGPFSVYLGGLLGPRRVLLGCAAVFVVISLILPFSPNLPVMLGLLVVAGLTSGTFYPLTLSFVLRNLPPKFLLFGIAAYAMDIIFTTNVASSVEAFYMDHLSWRWLFWNSALLTPPMIVLIYFGIPWQPLPQPKEGQPKPNWRGFLYASVGLALIYTALDQGQRLDWLHSGIIVGLLAGGIFLLAVTAVRRMRMPNPLIHFAFLARRNTLLLGVVLIFFRFILLSSVVLIPSYLGTIKGYLPLQTGQVLLWVALPQCLFGLAAVYLLQYIDARLILASGFTLVALGCLMSAGLTSAWSGNNFWVTEPTLAIGFALAFNGLVGSIILEVFNTGALSRPIDVLTFAGYFQTVRLLGGEAGSSFMGRFIPVREQFHSNILGLGVQQGLYTTDQRIHGLTAAFAGKSVGVAQATGRAVEVISLQVRQQAFTLAITDAFTLIAWACVCCLAVIACMAPVPVQYEQIVAAPAPS